MQRKILISVMLSLLMCFAVVAEEVSKADSQELEQADNTKIVKENDPSQLLQMRLKREQAKPQSNPMVLKYGQNQQSLFKIPSENSDNLKAPYAFETSFSVDDTAFYTVFTAVDTTGTGYNNPPYAPSNPSPPNNASGQPTTGIVLQWQGGDPDAGDTVTYDLYFDDHNNQPQMALIAPTLYQTRYNLSQQLNPGTTYYWYVVAIDNQGASTTGPVWSFTTSTTPVTPTPSPIPTNTPDVTATPTGSANTPTPTQPANVPDAPILNALPQYAPGKSMEVCWSNAPRAAEYWVEASLDQTFTNTLAASPWITNTCYQFNSLPEEVLIYFRARAKNAAGNSPWSNVVSCTMDASLPRIQLGGYLDSDITYTNGGELKIVALVQDNIGIENVEIFYQGQPTGAVLPEYQSNVYLMRVPVNAGEVPANRFLLELIATDSAGNRSMMWPYFVIFPPQSPAPGYSNPNAAMLILRELKAMSGLNVNDPTITDEGRKAAFNWAREMLQTVRGTTRKARIGDAPVIYAGGYWDTYVTEDRGGAFLMVAAVLDPQEDIATVQLHFNGLGTDVFLNDDGINGDMAANDDLYSFGTTFQPLPNGTAGSYPLELLATDQTGYSSTLWPYLTIGD